MIASIFSPFVGNNWIFIPVFSLVIFFFIYFGAEHIKTFVFKTALSNKEDIKRKLDLIYVDIEDQKLERYLLLCSYGLGFLFFMLFFPNIFVGLIVGAMVTFGGIQLPALYINSLYMKRCNKIVDQMVDGMTIMANGTKAGNPPAVAMTRVIENIKGPLSQEFRLVKNKERLGMSFEEALVEMSERVPMPDVQMFVMSVNILKETGGKIDQTFETINTVIRERQKLEKKISAMTAQGVMQGIMISVIPFLLLAFFWFANPEFISPMFNTTLGLILLCVMFGLQVMGGLMIKKIVTIKV